MPPAPQQAARRHRAVEHHQVDGQAAAAHPVGQHALRRAVERSQRNDPAGAQHQQQYHRQPLRRRQRQGRHHHGGEHRRQQHQPVSVEPLAQARQRDRPEDRPGAYRPQQHAVKPALPPSMRRATSGSSAQTELEKAKNTAARSSTTCSSRLERA